MLYMIYTKERRWHNTTEPIVKKSHMQSRLLTTVLISDQIAFFVFGVVCSLALTFSSNSLGL